MFPIFPRHFTGFPLVFVPTPKAQHQPILGLQTPHSLPSFLFRLRLLSHWRSGHPWNAKSFRISRPQAAAITLYLQTLATDTRSLALQVQAGAPRRCQPLARPPARPTPPSSSSKQPPCEIIVMADRCCQLVEEEVVPARCHRSSMLVRAPCWARQLPLKILINKKTTMTENGCNFLSFKTSITEEVSSPSFLVLVAISRKNH